MRASKAGWEESDALRADLEQNRGKEEQIQRA